MEDSLLEQEFESTTHTLGSLKVQQAFLRLQVAIWAVADLEDAKACRIGELELSADVGNNMANQHGWLNLHFNAATIAEVNSDNSRRHNAILERDNVVD
jgi:hypothetical protein